MGKLSHNNAFMKKIFCFLFLYIIAILAAIAQQDPQFSSNKQTQLTVNPGFAGNDGAISGIILNRYQWVGIDGAPKTLVFSVGSASKLFGLNSGIGFNIISDEIGFSKNISVGVDYAYRMKTGFGDLGIGTSLGFSNMSINADWHIPESDYYQTPEETSLETSQLAFDMGIGAFLRSKDYFAGFSVTHINQASIVLSDQTRTFLARHYYLSAGYNISLTDPLFELQPSVYFKSDGSSYQADFLVDLDYKKRYSVGLDYRINDAICVLLGFELNNGLKIGYAYDIGTSAVSSYSGGSHEFYLSYSLDLGKNRNKKYKSVRYL
jgi:type IX secretion system PorP/SprF family membrane protein